MASRTRITNVVAQSFAKPVFERADREESWIAAARKMAKKVWAMPIPEAEYCGFVCLLQSRHEMAVFGADGVHFFVNEDEVMSFVSYRNPTRANVFRSAFYDQRTHEATETIKQFSDEERSIIFNKAIVLIERRQMGWDRKGAEF